MMPALVPQGEMGMLVRDYTVRVCLIFFCFVILFLIIAIRLFLVQVKQKDFFKLLAQHQYELTITLNPPRGLIYDRTGKSLLAFNQQRPSAFIIPEQLVNSPRAMHFLKKYYPNVHQRILQYPDKKFLWLDRKLTKKKYDFLVRQEIKDIHFIDESQRYYPFLSAAQLVGITDIDNVGTAGIELAFTQQLGGSATQVKIERDARSGMLYFEKEVQKQGTQGKLLTTTIDSILQERAFSELKKTVDKLNAQAGSVIIINPSNGHILAMTNYPTFDPNQKSIQAVERMKNNVVNECYELGSVIKIFCALAALEEKVVDFDELIDCEGRFGYVDGVKIENPTLILLRILQERNNILPFHDVVRYSSNVGIAKIAKRLGPRFYTHLRRLGFGSFTNLQYPGERNGFVNPPERWSKPSLIVMSFGYELMVTLMQLAQAFCTIANDGYAVQPTLLISNEKVRPKRFYSTTTTQQIKSIMEKVCERYQIGSIRVMGKTGTARCVKDGKYSNKHHLFTFGGILEKGNYRRVIVTFIKEPEKASLWASETAFPLFLRIAEGLVIHDVTHHALNLT